MFEEVVIATKNQGKLREFSRMLNKLSINVHSLAEFENLPEVTEDGKTFAENAIKKAELIRDDLNLPVIADDSGLEVDILDGKPGIYSARFAGEEKDDQKNNEKLLLELNGIKMEERSARFISAIALAVPDGKTIVVQGNVEGLIAFEPKGNNGFGYDPLFYLPDYDKTIAEISPELKNRISHRAKALQKLIKLLDK